VIELELEDGEALADWLPALRELAGSAAVEQNGPVVRFTVEDADELPRIRQQLMIRLAELKAPLSRLEIARTSLEDLFMEAVRR